MNVYTPSRFDERITHLALGVEPRSAITGRRLDASVDVRLEQHPRPLHRWRTWRPGETLTAALPRVHRASTGRFARRYDELPGTTITVRVVDDERTGTLRRAGHGRRIVPRRIRVTIAAESVVLAADADPLGAPHPLWRRVFPVACFPGAAAELPSRSTVIRGLVAALDTVANQLVPVRWPRVRADGPGGVEVGWAHGDDRGEFVLVVQPPDGSVVLPADPFPVTLTVGATMPAAAPDPLDPLAAEVDPLWDLPIETVTASPTPDTEPTLTGRAFLPTHSQFTPIEPPQPIALPIGRHTSVVIRTS